MPTPRRIPDPLLPAGHWTVRLLIREPNCSQPETDPQHFHDQRIQIWPHDALTREDRLRRDHPTIPEGKEGYVVVYEDGGELTEVTMSVIMGRPT